jgi:hypothetical protein
MTISGLKSVFSSEAAAFSLWCPNDCRGLPFHFFAFPKGFKISFHVLSFKRPAVPPTPSKFLQMSMGLQISSTKPSAVFYCSSTNAMSRSSFWWGRQIGFPPDLALLKLSVTDNQ